MHINNFRSRSDRHAAGFRDHRAIYDTNPNPVDLPEADAETSLDAADTSGCATARHIYCLS